MDAFEAISVPEQSSIPVKNTFQWLKPIELDGWNGADVQTVDVGGVDEFPLELRVLRDNAADERGANPLEHFFLRTPDHADKREHELGIC